MAERRSQKRLKREKVLITGTTSGLGRLLCRRLHRHYDVVGVDIVPFADRPKDVEHHQVDLRRKSATLLLKKKKPQIVVHIGGMHGVSIRGSKLVDATVQLLKLVEQVGARKLIYISSATLYGPSPTSSSFLTEEAPLLGAGVMRELSDDISLDIMVQSFFWKNPSTETVILRPVHVVGPTINNTATQYLQQKTIPRLLGFDPMVQLIDEEDLASAVEQAVRPGVRGVFNLTGPTQAPLTRLIHARHAASLPLPAPLWSMAMERMRAFRISTRKPGELAFLQYSLIVDGDRARAELGYVPKRSLPQTLASIG